MAYYQYQEGSDTPQNWEEYYAKWGFQPGQKGWENLSNPERQWIKEKRAPYQGYTEQEEALVGEIWGDIKAGTPADIEGLEGLTERYQMSPAIRQYLIKKVGALFKGGPDYQDVYKAQKAKLDRALRAGERGIMESQAARGFSDSSATQARLGALEGEYTGTLADLLMGTAQMQETARSNRMQQGLGLMGLGLGWQESDISHKTALENLRNMLYMQDIGLKSEALNYLTSERARENQYLAATGGVPWEPLTFSSVLPGLITAGTQAYLASQTGGATLPLTGSSPFEEEVIPGGN